MPFPIIFRLNTVSTESWGDVDVSTSQLPVWPYTGAFKFETALFWNMDENDPNDPGGCVVATTFNGPRWAEIQHARWVNPDKVSIEIEKVLNQIKKGVR